jgi:catechol 2,3-dioxygenase-like lactoylglutathione lyase family enzyme
MSTDAAPDSPFSIDALDHFVLTVEDIERTERFYTEALGMTPVTFGSGRRALAFGPHKINLHQAGAELEPHAHRPTRGSADICLITTTPVAQVEQRLAAVGVAVELGPVRRTGARGPITSLYVRDPDGNLIEISNYDDQPA